MTYSTVCDLLASRTQRPSAGGAGGPRDTKINNIPTAPNGNNVHGVGGWLWENQEPGDVM